MNRELSDEFREEIRKEAKEQTAKWLIAGGAGLLAFATAGWVFAAKPYVDGYIRTIAKVENLVPEDAVMAFDLTPSMPCPEGWSRFLEATSRVILGAGNSDDFYEQELAFDDNGQRLSPRKYRQHEAPSFTS